MNADHLATWYLIVGMGCSTWAVVFLVARADFERVPLGAWQRLVVLVVCVAGGLVWPLNAVTLGVVAARPVWRRRLVRFSRWRGTSTSCAAPRVPTSPAAGDHPSRWATLVRSRRAVALRTRWAVLPHHRRVLVACLGGATLGWAVAMLPGGWSLGMLLALLLAYLFGPVSGVMIGHARQAAPRGRG